MNLGKIRYADLSGKQKEIYNFQKVAAVLADYGFNCIKLADDWQGADFLAYHKNGVDTLRVQLKARLTVDKKYVGKELYMSFPINDSWCLIEHDSLVNLIGENTNWLDSGSWLNKGNYHAARPSKKLKDLLEGYIL